jgi:hypothetical protein
MTTAAFPAIDSFSFNGEDVGIAGATALWKVRSLAERAPNGRLFATIATLADTSAAAAQAYEAAGLAELESEKQANIMHGNRLVHALSKAVGVTAPQEDATPLPAFIRRRATV